MLDTIIVLLSIFGLHFLIKESDGPWGIMAWLRNILIRFQFFGVFFYNLLDCSFCVGCHIGWIMYLIHEKTYHINNFIIWMLAGGTICLFGNAILNKLYQE